MSKKTSVAFEATHHHGVCVGRVGGEIVAVQYVPGQDEAWVNAALRTVSDDIKVDWAKRAEKARVAHAPVIPRGTDGLAEERDAIIRELRSAHAWDELFAPSARRRLAKIDAILSAA